MASARDELFAGRTRGDGAVRHETGRATKETGDRVGGGGGGGGGGDRMDEVRAIHARSSERLRGALRTLHETEAVAEDTAATLAEHGARIEGMRDKVKEINGEADRANWILKGMSSIWGSIAKSFTPEPPRHESATAPRPAAAAGSRARRDDREAVPRAASASASTSASTKAKAKGVADEEDAVVLAHMSESLGRLTEHGKKFGAELDSHITMLDEVAEGTDTAKDKLKKANRSTGKILRG